MYTLYINHNLQLATKHSLIPTGFSIKDRYTLIEQSPVWKTELFPQSACKEL